MPRAYNDTQRDAIRRRLMEIGEDRFARLGLRKTTIDELVGAARIGKGSFYLFFDSKEDLFLAIQERIEEEISRRFQEVMGTMAGDPPRIVRAFFETSIETLETHPFLQQLTDPEIVPLLARNVSPERLERMRAQNDSLYRDLFRSWVRGGVVRGIDGDTLFDLLTAVFVLLQNHRSFEEGPRAAVRWIVDAICKHAVSAECPR